MLFSILAAATAIASPTPSSAPLADLFVDSAQPNCASGNGTSSQPLCSISDAISLAANGDTVRIAPGTYVENLAIGVDLELIGTGGPDVTIVDGNAAGSVVVISNAVTVRIQGLTLRNGSASIGGGVLFEGDLTLSNSTITENVSTGYGGGGIGAFNLVTGLSLVNCEVSNNSALMGDGGGVLVGNADCTIHRSRITGNTSNYYGGGIQFIANNFTNYRLEVTDSTVSGNQVLTGGGGGILSGGTSLLLSGSTVSGNTAGGSGGGIDAFGSGFELVNSTISGNSSGYGGGVRSLGGVEPRSFSHVTIANNTAVTGGGGGVFTTGISNSIEIRNSIIADNIVLDPTAYPNAGADTWGSFVSQGHNFIGDGASGITNGVLNDQVASSIGGVTAMLGPLQLNGGPTETHDLLNGSLAIDAGDPLVFASVDQRGAPRPQDGAPDIGAVEKGTIGSDELCVGDGGDGAMCTPCACGNEAPAGAIGGCLNSSGMGGRLTRSGTASLSSGNLRFEAENLPSSSAAILLSGSAVAPANPANPCFGQGSGIQSLSLDGLRCVVQGVLRHGVRPADANGQIGVTTNGWGTPNGFFNFAAFSLGETRYFQVTYRDDPAAGCQTGLNTTQASSVTFVP